MVGGVPGTTWTAYADFFETVDGTMPFPGWEPFDGPDSADLDDDARPLIETVAVPVPEGVATAEVVYTDERRFEVPVVLVCPEYSPQEAKGWLDAGEIPELERVARVVRRHRLRALADDHPGRGARPHDQPRRRGGGTGPHRHRARCGDMAGLRRARRAQQRDVRRLLVHRIPPGGQVPGPDRQARKEERVRCDGAHAALCWTRTAWRRAGASRASPEELPTIKHRREYDEEPPPRPDWRITCFYVDTRHRGQGVARAALAERWSRSPGPAAAGSRPSPR